MNYLIVGGSRGLGSALLEGLPQEDDHVFVVSRTSPQINTDNITWIQADLEQRTSINDIADVIGDTPLHCLIYNAGVWDDSEKPFDQLESSSLSRVMDINTTHALLLIQSLLPSLRAAHRAKVVLIGSTAGLQVEGSCIAYGMSKMALRGLAEGLTDFLKSEHISVTCLNVGGMTTDVPLSKGIGASLEKYSMTRIPMQDIVETIKYIQKISPASFITEMTIKSIN